MEANRKNLTGMKVRNKKCKVCKKEFIPKYSTMQATCEDIECMLTWSNKAKDKRIKRELKEVKERNKSVSQWRKIGRAHV